MIKNKTSLILFLSFGLSLGGIANVFAAPAPIITSTQDRSNTEDHAFGIGFTVSTAQRPFAGVKDQNASLLYLSYRYKRFYIEGLDVGYNFYNNRSYSLDILGTPRFYEVKASFASNAELDGIDATQPSYFGGISAQVRTDFAIYTFQVLQDLIESNGNELVAQASKPLKLAKNFTLTPSIGFVLQNNKLVDHFYGVQANEVISGRPIYVAKSSLNYNVILNANWNITKHIDLLGQVKYEILGSGITDSPLVDKKSTYNFTVGAVYRFR